MRKLLILLLVFSLGISSSYSQLLVSTFPSSGTQGQTLTVGMTGQNTSFGMGTSTTNVWLQQGSSTIIYPNSTFILSNTTLSSEFTFCYSEIGPYDVWVNNSIDGDMILPLGFELLPGSSPPEIIIVDPDSAYLGEVLSVSITGQNVSFLQGTSTSVWLSQGTVTIQRDSVNVNSSFSMVSDFTIPVNANVGLWDVNVYDYTCLQQQVVLTEGFTIYDTVVGVPDRISEFYLNIFPNPSNGIVNLQYRIPHGQIGEFQVFNTNGVLVGRYQLQSGVKQSTLSIDLTDGLYLCRTIVDGEIIGTNKLVIAGSR